MTGDDTTLENHFRFGENWRDFLGTVDQASIAEAERGLSKLLPPAEITGRRFLDIGCGSGLSMLAALRLGAGEVQGVDLDPTSVAAARILLTAHCPEGGWELREKSVFDLSPAADGLWDIVHSWGVLHHTGAMWRAIDTAAALVAPGGSLVLALYRKTPLCGAWRAEKRLYARAPKALQAVLRGLYKGAYVAGLTATGRSPRRYVAAYRSARGMSWHHDVHDWLGGYPYESVTPDEVAAFLSARGFTLRRAFTRPAAAGGIFGTHCDEFVFGRA